MSKYEFVILNNDMDRTVSVELNGNLVAYANYDEHGSGGLDLAIDMTKSIVDAMNAISPGSASLIEEDAYEGEDDE